MNLMKYILPMICLNLLACQAFAEEDEVLPPPVVAESRADSADQDTQSEPESAPNLHEEFSAPDTGQAVDIRSYQRNDGAKITEYAIRGRVFKIKVQPAGGLPAYYLQDRDGDGVFEQRLPGGGKRISPPSWVLKEF
ncbi:DUF2782 domain-containing protein [Mariprofundus micogutta]|nr:DUF2782 domain-containing protein [Mariprofundus micogutta]